MKNYFEEVVGYNDVKVELERIVDLMRNPEKYRNLGVKTMRGLLLEGEPGVGKTLMSNCLIRASKRKAFTVRKDIPDGDFVKFIKGTFERAKKATPSIVFLDDMDKFANEDCYHRNTDEYITIQSCIDDCKDEDVFVLATANELDCIPESLLRPGRFDKRITILNPEVDDAEEIIKHYLKSKKVADNLDYREIAKLLNGRSCAALETVINEAGIYAGHENKEFIEREDLIRAFMRVIYNSPESFDTNDTQYLRLTAVHEAGHSAVAEILEPECVSFVSVKRYNGSNQEGFMRFEYNKDYPRSLHFMENEVLHGLAGKAATEIVYGTVDTGSGGDVNRVIEVIGRIVDDYSRYGFVNWEGSVGTRSLDSMRVVDRKAIVIQTELERYYQMTKRILIENREFLDKLTDELVEKKTLASGDIQRIKKDCNIVPFNPMYVNYAKQGRS